MMTKTKERAKDWRFQHGAVQGDVATFKAWVNYQIGADTARYRIAKNNGWGDPPTKEEFLQMANGFGYHRGIEEMTGETSWDF